MAFRCTCSKKGTAALWPRASPAVKTSRGTGPSALDRKSTRLNSSHLVISYAVFCLKKETRERGSRQSPDEPAHHPPLSTSRRQHVFFFTNRGPTGTRRLSPRVPVLL